MNTVVVAAQLRELPCRPIAEINMRLVSYYIERYRANDPYLSEGHREVAKAAIALEEAFAKKDYQTYLPQPGEQWNITDAEALGRATAAFGEGTPLRGVSWGVKRHEIPVNADVGEYVTIHYKLMGQQAIAAGFVTAKMYFGKGRGWVIRLMETNNGFNIQPGHGWRYVSLWLPNDVGYMAGFL